MTTKIFARELFNISSKQDKGISLSSQDYNFMMWYATHSRQCSEEFGRDARLEQAIDPQMELIKLSRYIESVCDDNYGDE
jgi:hypothetical protein